MMSTGIPLGPAVDPTAAAIPGDVKLQGRYGSLERLVTARHGSDLWMATRDHDRIWTYLPYGPFGNEAEFVDWLRVREQRAGPFPYVILDAQVRAQGIATLMEFRPAMRVIEVGHILYAPGLQRTALATEAQYLLARYVFEKLGYRRYEWKCNALNAASRQAALRFGFTFEGIFRQHMIVKGRSRDTAWYSMLDSEWPARKTAFERWLAPENFDSEGKQKTKLGGP